MMQNKAPKREHSEQVEEYLELCLRIYEKRVADGTWPWSVDSTNPENVIDSDSQHNDV